MALLGTRSHGNGLRTRINGLSSVLFPVSDISVANDAYLSAPRPDVTSRDFPCRTNKRSGLARQGRGGVAVLYMSQENVTVTVADIKDQVVKLLS